MDTKKRKKSSPRKLTKKTLGQLHKTLWPIFSLHIKLKHSHDGRWCSCYTCGNPIEIGKINCQGGHFIARGKSPTKYHEDNVRPQCSGCNMEEKGEFIRFEKALMEEIGYHRVQALKELSEEAWKWNRLDLIDMIERYRQLNKEMQQ